MKRSLTRTERLRSRSEIQRVVRTGKHVATQGMRLAYLPHERRENRIVVIPTRGFGTAVQRNLCRRHGKEAYRALKAEIRIGYDLAILCYPGDYSFAERRHQLFSLLRKAHLLRESELSLAASSKEM